MTNMPDNIDIEDLENLLDSIESLDEKAINISTAQSNRFMNPDERSKISEARRKYLEDNPDAVEGLSRRTTEFFEKHPEARVAASEKTKQQFEDPAQRAAASDRAKKQMENAEYRAHIHKAAKAWASRPENIQAVIERNRRLLEDPTKHFNFKGSVVGTNIDTGEKITLTGTRQIEAAGFVSQKISQCISGKRKSHGNHTWVRLIENDGETVEQKTEYTNDKAKRKPYKIHGKNANGDIVYEYASMKDVGNDHHRGRVTAAIKTGEPYKNLYWIKVEI